MSGTLIHYIKQQKNLKLLFDKVLTCRVFDIIYINMANFNITFKAFIIVKIYTV